MGVWSDPCGSGEGMDRDQFASLQVMAGVPAGRVQVESLPRGSSVRIRRSR